MAKLLHPEFSGWRGFIWNAMQQDSVGKESTEERNNAVDCYDIIMPPSENPKQRLCDRSLWRPIRESKKLNWELWHLA